MTKSELAAKLAKDANVSIAAAERALKAIITAISKDLAKGGRVALPGLGAFSVTDRAERQGTNLRTGEKITIPACKAVKFTAAQALKDAVNG